MHNPWRHDIVVIGGSTGGLEALGRLLGSLPSDLAATLLIVLHIPSDFPSILPELLSKSGKWQVRHPANGARFGPGQVFVAPPDFHLVIEQSQILLTRGPKENRHRPAIDVLFRSAARAYGPRVAAVLLSGQLDDGSAGLMAVKMRGGLTIVQDPEEATAPEMPSRAIQYVNPEHVLPIHQISELLASISGADLPLPATETTVPDKIENETKEALFEESTGDKKIGKLSVFACPDCHGVLWELEEGKLLRFRCRVGHAYTADALSLAMSEAGEDALWVAMRALEEKAGLMRRMAARSGTRMGLHYEDEAAGFDMHAQTIREMLAETHTQTNKEESVSAQRKN